MLNHATTIMTAQVCARFAAITEVLLGVEPNEAPEVYNAHWKALVDPLHYRENISRDEAKRCLISIAKKAIELLEGK